MISTGRLLLASGLLVAPLLAQQGDARERLLARECRHEVVKLCGFNRDEMRTCLRENRDALSAPCKTQLAQAMAKRMRQSDASAATTTSRPVLRPPSVRSFTR